MIQTWKEKINFKVEDVFDYRLYYLRCELICDVNLQIIMCYFIFQMICLDTMRHLLATHTTPPLHQYCQLLI